MFIKKETVEKVEFIDVHGDKIGYCSLIVRTKEDGRQYAVIDSDFPNSLEYTTWHNLKEARQAFESDLQYYTDKYRDI